MYRYFLVLGLAPLAACGNKDEGGSDTDAAADADTDSDADTDTDTDADTDSDTDTDSTTGTTGVTTTTTGTTAACDAMTSGTWGVNGSAFGMAMTVDLNFDQATCQFTLSNWSMAMGQLPTGGTVAGDQVTLAGAPDWNTCTGTLSGGTQVTGGICSSDGSNFQLGKQ